MTPRLHVLVLTAFLSACSHDAGKLAGDLQSLPRFGEPRSSLESRIGPYRIEYGKAVIPSYRFRVGSDVVRLTMLYATRKDGRDIVSGIEVHADNIEDGLDLQNTEVPEAARKAIIEAIVPDRKRVPIVSLPPSVREDASPPTASEDSAFFESKALARTIVQRPYWDIPNQRWALGVCASSPPGIVQIYISRDKGATQKAGVYSEYLYECMKRSMD